MPSHSDAAVVTGPVRDAIAFTRLPWIRPLVSAHAHAFESVAPVFAGNPADPTAWTDAMARVRSRARSHQQVAQALAAQQHRRASPDAAREAARRLANPDAVAVVTGQQAGLFGGPLYTLLKAITTVQLARHVERTHGVPVVPIFWVDAEDHDWDEVCRAQLLDRDGALASVALEPFPGCGAQPVGSVMLTETVGSALGAFEEKLPPTEFTSELAAMLRRRYVPGATMAGAFAGLMDDLLGAEGLVVFEAGDQALKPAVADLFAAELAQPGRTAAYARSGAATLARLGHAPQIEPADDMVCLFYLDDQGRRPIRLRDGQYLVGDRTSTPAALAAEAAAHPERFSPNVLLRPLVQDRLFPTVCYVAGPSELAYQSQLGGAYEAFGIAQPLLCSRASATLLDSAAARFLERQQLPLEDLQPQDESALNRLLERQLPPGLDESFQQITEHITQQAARIKSSVVAVEPTLAGAVDTTVDRISDTLKTLHGKIVQASKKKDETLRRQFTRTQALAFPAGQPQERVLSLSFFINRYGPHLPVRLIESLPPLAHQHYVVTP